MRLKPLPKYNVDLLAVFPTVDSAIGIVHKLLKAGISPTCVEFIENSTIRCIERFLNEKLPNSDVGNYIIIQVEGKDEDDIDDKSVLLDEMCTENGALTVLVADSEKIWRARKNFSEAIRNECLIVAKEDVVVPSDLTPKLLQLIAEISKKHNLVTRMASHAGDGNLHVSALKNDTPDDLWEKKVEAFHHDLYEGVYKLGGRISGEHGIGLKRKELMETYTNPIELNLMRAVKKAFDPNLILNPGKIFDVE